MLRRALVIAVALMGIGMPVRAQELARIDSLLNAGRFTAARSAFERWRTENPRNARDVPANVHARALLLEGRMATAPDAAIDAYLALALGYPTADETPLALLRLGQGLLATNQPERARAYLERLALDYPRATERAEGLLWLARAQIATGRSEQACPTLRDAMALRTSDAGLRARLEQEHADACSAQTASTARDADAAAVTPAAPSPSPRAAQQARPDPPAAEPQTQPSAPTGNARDSAREGRYSVQAGAFSTAERAQRLVERLAARGFDDTRVVYLPTSRLARVRLGRFTSASDAAALANRVRAAGFDAAVVTDATSERTSN